MAKVKQSLKKHISPKDIIAIAGLAILILVPLGIWVNAKIQQQRDLDELASASKDLRAVYDQLLKENEGNVASSYFRNECSYANLGVYSRSVSCGQSADISTKNDMGIEGAHQVILSASKNSHFFSNITTNIVNETVNTGIVAVDDFRCYIAYGGSQQSNSKGFHISCRKPVPDFLPGYKIVD